MEVIVNIMIEIRHTFVLEERNAETSAGGYWSLGPTIISLFLYLNYV